jgi:hypothetical protein
LAVGGVLTVGGLAYATTQMSHIDAPLAMPVVAIGLVMVAGALLRRARGKPVFDPARLRETHLQSASLVGTNFLRLFAWMVDCGVCAIVSALIWILLDEALPRGMGDASDWAFDHTAYGIGAWRGLDYWRAARPHFFTSEAQEIFGPFLCTLVVGAYLFIPAAAASGTPMMRAFRLRWLRPSDGERVGAIHGVVRALAGAVLAPLQVAFVTITLVFGSGGRYRTGTGGIVYGRHRIRDVADARRNLMDLICRTETMRIPKNWGV